MPFPPPALGSRALFPALSARAYLAHAAVSPLSAPVCDAVQRTLSHYGERGIAAAIAQVEPREALRSSLAQLLSVAPAQIGFVQSMTVAATLIARSIGLRKGERVVLFDGEFPANVLPFQYAAAECGADIVRLPLAPYARAAEEGLAELEAVLQRGVRLVAVSAVEFQTGLAMPIARMAELAHRYGAEIFVDAIQAVGVMPFDAALLDVDYAAASGHKFLMGPEGTGFLYVHPRALARLSRGFAGWTSVVDAFQFLTLGPGLMRYDAPVVERASFVEQGAQNILGQAGLGAAVGLLLELGVDAIFAHVSSYLDALEPALIALGCASLRSADPRARSACLCVRVPARAPALREVASRLAQQGVVASTPDGQLRFAPHFANHVDELPHVMRALEHAFA